MGISHDIITYLKENFGDQRDFLMLKQVTTAKPLTKPKPVIALPPAPKKEVKTEAVEKDLPEPPPSFITEKPTITKTPIASEMEAIYQKIAPKVSLSKDPLSDAVAKQIRTASTKRSELPEIPIFSDPGNAEFLTRLAEAITANFGKSSLIPIKEFEEKNLWKPLLAGSTTKLIILPETLLKHSPNLLMLTKEYPGRLLRSIEKIPLLALTDLRNTPARKKEIWTLLQRFFKA